MKIQGSTFAEIYEQLIKSIYLNPEYISSPRGMKIKEQTNLEITLTDPTSNLFTNVHRSPNPNYLYPELLWYFLGRNDLDFISNYSKFWNKLTNDGILNSAYGNLLFTQKNEHGYSEYGWALESLINDKDSRQSILRFNKPVHSYKGNKDFVCTLNGIFNIRNNKLNFTTTMRSQDVWFGITYDMPFFTILMQQVLLHLQEYYPDLTLGKYVHYVLSEHIYEKDFNNIEQMLLHPFIPDSTPLVKYNLIDKYCKPSDKLLYALNTRNVLLPEYTNDDLINNIIKYLKIK